MKFINYLIIFCLISSIAEAHVFTGMIGFYDGISHPVLGLDHFLAMVSVGIISAQIGGAAIWKVPLCFVSIMLIGGIIGIYTEINQILQVTTLNEIGQKLSITEILVLIIEIGILFSVIVLGITIAIEKKLPITIVMFFVGLFGFFHGSAHGLEMPWAANPLLFAAGFATGTATLHIFGVLIGYFLKHSNLSNILLKIIGLCFAGIGIYSLINF